jgi:hypothetical protein
MTTVEDQSELALARPPQSVSISLEVVRAQKSNAAAFSLACSVSGLEDKEIYMALGIDAGYFSNIKKGKATLQGDLVRDFCKVVGNTIYLEWLAYQIGCTLMLIRSEAERRAEDAEKRARSAEEKLHFLTQVVQGKVAL